MDIAVATRPMRPDDGARLCRMWPRLSPDTVYRRFHAPLPGLTAAAVARLVDVDHDHREALVVVLGDEVVGVARYDRSPADRGTAELAVVVEDAWQGVGLGRQLLLELTALAAARGVRSLTATIQPDNGRALHLAARLLPGATVHADRDAVTVTGPAPTRPPAAPPRPALQPA